MTFLKSSTEAITSPLDSKRDRNAIRALLRKSGSNKACAFSQASACYFDFLSEYFYLLGYTDQSDRLAQIRATLVNCWRYSPYIRRVSDFERSLDIQLEARSANKPAHGLGAPHTRVNRLTHQQRFLLVARGFNNWSYRALHLATRIKKHEISSALTEVKCELVNFDPKGFKTSQHVLLLRVNDLLEGELKMREYRTIENELLHHPEIKAFKVEWLSYRCELAELRQQMTLSPETQDAFKAQLREDLQAIPITQPKLRDTLINQFSFTGIPTT